MSTCACQWDGAVVIRSWAGFWGRRCREGTQAEVMSSMEAHTFLGKTCVYDVGTPFIRQRVSWDESKFCLSFPMGKKSPLSIPLYPLEAINKCIIVSPQLFWTFLQLQVDREFLPKSSGHAIAKRLDRITEMRQNERASLDRSGSKGLRARNSIVTSGSYQMFYVTRDRIQKEKWKCWSSGPKGGPKLHYKRKLGLFQDGIVIL